MFTFRRAYTTLSARYHWCCYPKEASCDTVMAADAANAFFDQADAEAATVVTAGYGSTESAANGTRWGILAMARAFRRQAVTASDSSWSPRS